MIASDLGALNRSRNLRYDPLALRLIKAVVIGCSVVLGAHLVLGIIAQRHGDHPILIALVHGAAASILWALTLILLGADCVAALANRVVEA